MKGWEREPARHSLAARGHRSSPKKGAGALVIKEKTHKRIPTFAVELADIRIDISAVSMERKVVAPFVKGYYEDKAKLWDRWEVTVKGPEGQFAESLHVAPGHKVDESDLAFFLKDGLDIACSALIPLSQWNAEFGDDEDSAVLREGASTALQDFESVGLGYPWNIEKARDDMTELYEGMSMKRPER